MFKMRHTTALLLSYGYSAIGSYNGDRKGELPAVPQ